MEEFPKSETKEEQNENDESFSENVESEDINPNEEMSDQKETASSKTPRIVTSFNPIEVKETPEVLVKSSFMTTKPVSSSSQKKESKMKPTKETVNQLKEKVKAVEKQLSNLNIDQEETEKFKYTPTEREGLIRENVDKQDGSSFLVFPELGNINLWIDMNNSQGTKVNKAPLNSKTLLRFLDVIRSLGIPFESKNLCIKNFLKDVLKKILEFQYRDISDASETTLLKLKDGYVYENGIVYFDPTEAIYKINRELILSLLEVGIKKGILETEKGKSKNDKQKKFQYQQMAKQLLEIYDSAPNEESIKQLSEILESSDVGNQIENEKLIEYIIRYEPNNSKMKLEKNLSSSENQRKIQEYAIESKLDLVFENMGKDIESILLGLPRSDDATQRLNRNYAQLISEIKDTVNDDVTAFLPKETTANGQCVPPKLNIKLKDGIVVEDILKNWTIPNEAAETIAITVTNSKGMKEVKLVKPCTYPEELKYNWIPSESREDLERAFRLWRYRFLPGSDFKKLLYDLKTKPHQMDENGIHYIFANLNGLWYKLSEAEFDLNPTEYELDMGLNSLNKENDVPTLRSWMNNLQMKNGKKTEKESGENMELSTSIAWWDVYPLIYILLNLPPPSDYLNVNVVKMNSWNQNLPTGGKQFKMFSDVPLKYFRASLISMYGDFQKDDSVEKCREKFIKNVFKDIKLYAAKLDFDELENTDEFTPTEKYADIIGQIWDFGSNQSCMVMSDELVKIQNLSKDDLRNVLLYSANFSNTATTLLDSEINSQLNMIRLKKNT